MDSKGSVKWSLALFLILVVIGSGAWFIRNIFEGEQPGVALEPLPEYLKGEQAFVLKAVDAVRGLRRLVVSVTQAGREIQVLEKKYGFEGLLNRGGTHAEQAAFTLEPAKLNLAQGRVDLQVQVWDYSRRSGGDGNRSVLQHKMVVDTIAPAIRAVSRLHYVSAGGSGVVVYQVSSDGVDSGLFAGDLFFRGFPEGGKGQEGYHTCYFAVPHDADTRSVLTLWARDRAGNESRTNFNYKILKGRFREEKITITDRFLETVLPYFTPQEAGTGGSAIERFLRINRDLRKQNDQTFFSLRDRTDAARLWEGPWLRMKNSANMSRFGDRRFYYYQGAPVDEQFHLGVDLASLAQSEVEAANHGRVIHAGRLGIYGSTVVLDHGQGVASVYAHLSQISVQPGQGVRKGDIIGFTGQTGLAGGDHLHFGVLVGGIPVSPVEWWDPHWIQDNVERKLELLQAR